MKHHPYFPRIEENEKINIVEKKSMYELSEFGKNFVKCVCIKVCDLLMYKWQQIGNRKSASQNNICNRDKITAEKR